MWIIQKNAGSDENQDSIQEMKNRFGSGEIGGSEIVYLNKYPIRWDFVNHKHRAATLRYLFYEIRQLSNSVKIDFEYHTVFRDVNCSRFTPTNRQTMPQNSIVISEFLHSDFQV